MGGGAQIAQDHVNRDRPSEEVVVSGNPGRAPVEHRIRVYKIVCPATDGSGKAYYSDSPSGCEAVGYMFTHSMDFPG